MKPNNRFIQSVLASAKDPVPAMPWTRGAPRAERIARRDTGKVIPLKVKSA